MSRARLVLGALLATGGAAAVADAAVTVAWQEPVGALKASAAQSDLEERYATVAARYAATAPAAAPRVTPAASSSGRARRASARTALLRRARSAVRLGATTQPGEPLGRLRIPAIGLSTVWVQSTRSDALRKGPGHYGGTALPGRRGTVGIAGHRTTHGAPFRRLDQLDPGDRVELSMPYGTYVYAVQRTRIVSPDQAEVLRAARTDRLVLTACHPLWSAEQRIVVTARLVRAAAG